MPKRPNIVWTERRFKTLEKTIAHFNHTIDVRIRDDPSLIKYLPEKKTLQDVAKNIDTESDYKRSIRQMESFDRWTATKKVEGEAGVKTTKWQYDIYKREYQASEKSKAEKRAAADFSTEKGNMGQEAKQNLKPSPFNFDKMKQKEWLRKLRVLDNKMSGNYDAKKAADYKENYIKAIEGQLGESGGEANSLQALIQGLSAEFIAKHYSDNATMAIDFPYNADEVGADDVEADAIKAWEKAIEEAKASGEDYMDEGWGAKEDEFADADVTQGNASQGFDQDGVLPDSAFISAFGQDVYDEIMGGGD